MVRSIFALTAVLSVASASLAGDLVTPPIFVGDSTIASCKLLNITSAPIPAQFQLIAAGGTVLADSAQTTVAPGDVGRIVATNPNTFVFCRFVRASKSKVRAGMTTFVVGSDKTDQLVAVAQ